MSRFYAEDVATSAIGRAILLLKGAEKTAHKEGVERAKSNFEVRAKSIIKEKVEVEKPSDPWTIETKEMPVPVAEAVAAINDNIVPEEIPMCPTHNVACEPKEGNTRGKAWKHYKCPRSWVDKCEFIERKENDKSGQWRPQRPKTQQGVMN